MSLILELDTTQIKHKSQILGTRIDETITKLWSRFLSILHDMTYDDGDNDWPGSKTRKFRVQERLCRRRRAPLTDRWTCRSRCLRRHPETRRWIISRPSARDWFIKTNFRDGDKDSSICEVQFCYLDTATYFVFYLYCGSEKASRNNYSLIRIFVLLQPLGK